MSLELELDQFFTDETTESATYNVFGGSSVAVVPIVDRGKYAQEQSGKYAGLGRTVEIYLQTSELSAAPNVNRDTITFDGQDWGITGYEPVGTDQAYRLTVERLDVREVSRDGYRR